MPLLNDEAVSGPMAIQRLLFPAPVAKILDEDDYPAAVQAVAENCGSWGGAYHLLVPAKRGADSLEEPWRRFISASALFGVSGNGILDVPDADTAASRRMYGYPRSDGIRTDPSLLTVLAWSGKDRSQLGLVNSCHDLDMDDPWHLSYCAVWGLLPESADPLDKQLSRIAADVRYTDLIDFADSPAALSHEHLLESLRSASTTMATRISCFSLSATRSTSGNQFGETPAIPLRWSTAYNFGPNLIVVYNPGSVRDLCLLWNLRAIHGLNSGLPLGVPITADVPRVAAHWVDSLAALKWGMLDTKCALISASVASEKLQALARAVPGFEAANWADFLQPSTVFGIPSSETVSVVDGKCRVVSISQHERAVAGADVLEQCRARLSLEIVIQGRQLPHSPTMLAGNCFEDMYRGGPITSVSTRRDFVSVGLLTGLDVLHAVVADTGLRCELSASGRLATQTIAAIGGLRAVGGLQAPTVMDLLRTLTVRRGQAYVKKTLRDFLSVASEASKPSKEQASADTISMLLRAFNESVGPPEDDDDRPEVAFARIKEIFGHAGAARSWINWAEDHSILVRGTRLGCELCGHKGWRPIADLAPPIICQGCGRRIPRPFREDVLNYSYRASEAIVRAMGGDVFSHILAQRFFEALYDSSPDDQSILYGGYPGVDFYDGSERVGEADVALILLDGRLVLGECKTRAIGLDRSELDKLWWLADRVGAAATFVATLDGSAACGETWRMTRSTMPHFALTAQHLFDPLPVWLLGQAQPLEWRSEYSYGPRKRVDQAGLVAKFNEAWADGSDSGRRGRPTWRH